MYYLTPNISQGLTKEAKVGNYAGILRHLLQGIGLCGCGDWLSQ